MIVGKAMQCKVLQGFLRSVVAFVRLSWLGLCRCDVVAPLLPPWGLYLLHCWMLPCDQLRPVTRWLKVTSLLGVDSKSIAAVHMAWLVEPVRQQRNGLAQNGLQRCTEARRPPECMRTHAWM
jgi:hypothetical protein